MHEGGTKTTGIEHVLKSSLTYEGMEIREANTPINIRIYHITFMLNIPRYNILIYSGNITTVINTIMNITCGVI